jgi:transcriptional regulator with XRE-family HTH domain
MADELEVSQSWVSKLESGFINPDFDILLKIVDYLGISLDDLTSPEFIIETQNNYDHAKGVYVESENNVLKEYIQKLETLIQQKDEMIQSLLSQINKTKG